MIQFQDNLGIMSKDNLKKLQQINIVIVGLGGLGGHIANTLARLGVKTMTLIDFDTFSQSNLNRQLFSTCQTIGEYKVDVIKRALLKINPKLSLSIRKSKIQDIDFLQIKSNSLLVDAVDNIETKLSLETIAHKLKIPLFHSALAGWFGQLGISLPNSKLLHDIYQNKNSDLTKIYKSPSFTPAIIANMVVCEIVKYIVNPKKALINKILQVDLLNHEYHIIYDKQ